MQTMREPPVNVERRINQKNSFEARSLDDSWEEKGKFEGCLGRVKSLKNVNSPSALRKIKRDNGM